MDWLSVGLLLIVLGMLFIAMGILRVPASEAKVEAAAVLFIGPIPIVLGTSVRAALVALLASILILIMVIVWLKL
ncbi:MAG: DUF131 domain-containing protein [Candidatus Diapherotrites archaeon]|nr:DUF131 domain-containing protein [Candidatus Diapherotrites archaeon]